MDGAAGCVRSTVDECVRIGVYHPPESIDPARLTHGIAIANSDISQGTLVHHTHTSAAGDHVSPA